VTAPHFARRSAGRLGAEWGLQLCCFPKCTNSDNESDSESDNDSMNSAAASSAAEDDEIRHDFVRAAGGRGPRWRPQAGAVQGGLPTLARSSTECTYTHTHIFYSFSVIYIQQLPLAVRTLDGILDFGKPRHCWRTTRSGMCCHCTRTNANAMGDVVALGEERGGPFALAGAPPARAMLRVGRGRRRGCCARRGLPGRRSTQAQHTDFLMQHV
jgi:hypothetical protein